MNLEPAQAPTDPSAAADASDDTDPKTAEELMEEAFNSLLTNAMFTVLRGAVSTFEEGLED
ncbi:hypothetical protein [Jannaschia sp. LMIT008]|uniref:hypothetical protein n=1 Tax=Jannaschia maritima TaxID=3032585 RepID=UPI0028114B9A|nr:hypothetical protein [Jannaschia sp. LMIT008]